MGMNLYVLADGKTSEMYETLYDKEDTLQKIIADNPDILARKTGPGSGGPEPEPRQLYLVKREQGIHSLSLDHLLVDRNGVPVLVEVKRSTDGRICREVAAQMLDYAASVSSLDVRELKTSFEQDNPGVSVVPGFWETVANNLKAERVKLVFAADRLPDSLRIMIEFLDRAMPDIEVYGVEIHPYKSGDTTLLATESVENTLTANVKSARGRGNWNEESSVKFLSENGFGDFVPVWGALQEKAEKLGMSCEYGSGPTHPSLLLKYRGLTVFALGAEAGKSYVEIGSRYLAGHLGCDAGSIQFLAADHKGCCLTKDKAEFYSMTETDVPSLEDLLEKLVSFIREKTGGPEDLP